MPQPPPTLSQQSFNRFVCEFEKYLSYTEDLDLDEDEQRVLIATMWNIMLRLIGIEFGFDAAQLILEERQRDKNNSLNGENIVVQSGHPITTVINPQGSFKEASGKESQ